MTLPADVRGYPDVIAQALNQLRLAGVNGPYALVLGADAYTAVSGGSDDGYPVLAAHQASGRRRDHLGAGDRRRPSCSPPAAAISTCISARTSPSATSATPTRSSLYLQESFTFLLLTTEAAVALTARKNVVGG